MMTIPDDDEHVSEVLVPGFGRPVLLCRGKMPRARGMAAYIRDGYGAFRQPKFEFPYQKFMYGAALAISGNHWLYLVIFGMPLEPEYFQLVIVEFR